MQRPRRPEAFSVNGGGGGSSRTDRANERAKKRRGKNVFPKCGCYASPTIGTGAIEIGHPASTISGIRDVAPLLLHHPPTPAVSVLLLLAPLSPEENTHHTYAHTHTHIHIYIYILRTRSSVFSLYLSLSFVLSSQHPGHIDASSRNIDGLSCNNAHGS